jgi:hypothetical protein
LIKFFANIWVYIFIKLLVLKLKLIF